MSKRNKLGERSCLLQPFASTTEKVLRRFKKTENCPVSKIDNQQPSLSSAEQNCEEGAEYTLQSHPGEAAGPLSDFKKHNQLASAISKSRLLAQRRILIRLCSAVASSRLQSASGAALADLHLRSRLSVFQSHARYVMEALWK
ncbi:uncharacterized protein LOC113777843 [Coffea eugenioides]|uniref:uncharacterized protein LOC113777843 n=1 Tax=Coffea eugenioides TaxID=49369 RepID=UPI000F6141AD|nr:uncharacterized protein LOC113777843 [Coffea eugenioides]